MKKKSVFIFSVAILVIFCSIIACPQSDKENTSYRIEITNDTKDTIYISPEPTFSQNVMAIDPGCIYWSYNLKYFNIPMYIRTKGYEYLLVFKKIKERKK